MKRRRVRLRRLVPLAFLLIPPLFWATILAVTPTEWARARIVSKLAEETRRPIRLGGLKIGVLGGIYLLDLEVGASGAGAGPGQDPWLKAASARIDVSVLQLLAGQMEPSKIQVNGLVLRVLRRNDGSLELADLLGPAPNKQRTGAADETEAPTPLEIELHDGQIAIVDEPSHTRLNLTNIQGHAAWQGRQLAIQDLQGNLNGGVVELALSLDRTLNEPVFEGRFRVQGVELDRGTNALVYLVPVLAGTTDDGALEGRLDANFYVKGRGATREALRRSLIGQGNLQVDSIALERSRFFVELRNLVDLPDKVQVGSVMSDFAIKEGRVVTDNLTLDVAHLPVTLTGWTDFNGRLEYHVRSDSLTDKLPEQARDLLADLSIDTEALSLLRVHGTLQALQVSIDPRSLVKQDGPGGRGTEREKLRELGRRVRDRILR
jgi:uncharacterized protein involved in outer membrane biogenesis